ncbi:MAG: hypothetical protein QNJ55_25740 [Xenococcus sp. MO_188.B8]|nr:hypothetical protein [Xenococcus sp. MO_188.B8]
MLKQIIKESQNKSFRVSRISNSIAICEANKEDRFNWGNSTENQPAFLVYLGCSQKDVSGYIQTFNIFYKCEYCETRKPKYLKGFEVEIKIRGMQRKGNAKCYGLDDLLRTEASKHVSSFNIDLDFCMDDIAENYAHQEEYQQIPLEKIKEILFEGINNLIDDFANNPNQYLNQDLSNRFIKLASEYQKESIDYDEYNYYVTDFMPRY